MCVTWFTLANSSFVRSYANDLWRANAGLATVPPAFFFAEGDITTNYLPLRGASAANKVNSPTLRPMSERCIAANF